MNPVVFRLLFLFSFSIGIHGSNAQVQSVNMSGLVRKKIDRSPLSFANVVIKSAKDSSFITGTITNDEGRFIISNLKPGSYLIESSHAGYQTNITSIYVGSLSPNIDIASLDMVPYADMMEHINIRGNRSAISADLEKKTFSVSDNISGVGGSILQAMQNLPGVTIQDGKIFLRGSDKVAVLMDGKQTAMTGFGSQSGLDNLPASAIQRIEIINNPNARFDANGNAGVINIILRKNDEKGWNAKLGFSSGLGSLWVRKDNLPTIRPQYTLTPKINPSFSINRRKERLNIFFQADNLYTETLNKNEYADRYYDDGTVIRGQLKRNRNTNFLTTKSGVDWYLNPNSTLTFSGLFGTEKIIDRGDQPFFNGDLSKRLRLWQFLEDELKTTVMASAAFRHAFKEAGHQFNLAFNYTFHREDEQYFYDNILASGTGKDAFKLLSDEQVFDLTGDYVKPLKQGRMEAGFKVRRRTIPTNMDFRPGLNSILDIDAGGWADYREIIPAVYGNYVLEKEYWEAELGMRMEYVAINYDVNPNHRTYKSDGYHYTQPFPSLRLAYKFDAGNKISIFYNRRVDRPNEVDIRIFPKYDDAEIIKVGNPGLRPQFTNSIELGYKKTWPGGSLYTAAFHRFSEGTITRISSILPGSSLIYAIFQNAGKSRNTGVEMILDHKPSSKYSFSLNATLYRNEIDSFSVRNLYPRAHQFSAEKQRIMSGNIKWNNIFRLSKGWEFQTSAVYMAPDIIPQGKIYARLSIDAGLKKTFRNKKNECFLNATDIAGTYSIRRKINGAGFYYTSHDYYETQVIKIGYTHAF